MSHPEPLQRLQDRRLLLERLALEGEVREVLEPALDHPNQVLARHHAEAHGLHALPHVSHARLGLVGREVGAQPLSYLGVLRVHVRRRLLQPLGHHRLHTHVEGAHDVVELGMVHGRKHSGVLVDVGGEEPLGVVLWGDG